MVFSPRTNCTSVYGSGRAAWLLSPTPGRSATCCSGKWGGRSVVSCDRLGVPGHVVVRPHHAKLGELMREPIIHHVVEGERASGGMRGQIPQGQRGGPAHLGIVADPP